MTEDLRIKKGKKFLTPLDIRKTMESIIEEFPQDKTEVYRLLYEEKMAQRELFTRIPRGCCKSLFSDLTLREVDLEVKNDCKIIRKSKNYC